MNTIKNLIFRWKRVISSSMTLTSTSTLVSWSPPVVINPGTILDWTVSGGVTIATTTINQPNFNFSTNSGIANVLIENTNDLTSFTFSSLDITSITISDSLLLTFINLNDNNLTSFSLPIAGSLATLLLRNNSLTSFSVPNSTPLTVLVVSNNSLSTLDVSPFLLSDLECHGNSFSVAVTNQVLADLVANGVNNGNLNYRNNETGQGVTDRATLITRGWTIINQTT